MMASLRFQTAYVVNVYFFSPFVLVLCQRNGTKLLVSQMLSVSTFLYLALKPDRPVCFEVAARSFQLMHTKSIQLCPTLCDPMDHSPLGSSVHGILQERIFGDPPPGDLPDPGIEPTSSVPSALEADSFTTEPLGSPSNMYLYSISF